MNLFIYLFKMSLAMPNSTSLGLVTKPNLIALSLTVISDPATFGIRNRKHIPNGIKNGCQAESNNFWHKKQKRQLPITLLISTVSFTVQTFYIYCVVHNAIKLYTQHQHSFFPRIMRKNCKSATDIITA
jgi:hypothetical protein